MATRHRRAEASPTSERGRQGDRLTSGDGQQGPPRAIIHLDMDAFYASVEQRDDPKLRGRPVIVGGYAQRGVVLAASYEVRPFGVRSAMPMSRALRLAPDAVVVPPRMRAYADASERVFDILGSVTPLVEGLSLDEAFLDVTASLRLFGTAGAIATMLRRRIADELALPASAGIADVKFVAKIASDVAKPNGQHEVAPGENAAFLAPLPIARLWGVGPKTEERLKRLGFSTIGDLARCEPAALERKIGAAGLHFAALGRGIDPRPVVPDRDAKSIGAEETFDEDLRGVGALRPHLHAQALRVARRLRRAGLRARGLQLKLKLADFKLVTRQCTFDAPTDDGQSLYRAAAELLDRNAPAQAVRLTGVSAHGLEPALAAQTSLLEPPPSPRDVLNQTLDRITARFGTGAVTTADIADAGGEPDERDTLDDRRDR
jgi:DNA polymerase-4